MKTLNKLVLFIIVLFATLFLFTNFSHAATEVNDETSLREAINSAEDNAVIELTTNISLTNPIEIVGKTITIDGKGNTITKDDSWNVQGSNRTLITAGSVGTKLTLKNLKLTNGEKYGVQSYNGAHVVLDGVTITNCGFGAVLVNAGTVEVKDLHLGRNGQTSNNGIEIAKGFSVDTGSNEPTLIMNGTLTSSEPENVIYLAINDTLTDFEVQNTEESTNKIFISGNKVVITDAENNILYSSNERDDISMEGETFTANVTVTIHLNDKTLTTTVKEGTSLTRKDLENLIDLEELGLEKYTLTDFYTDKEFKTKFNFDTKLTEDIAIYAKLDLKETAKPNDKDKEDDKAKDDTEKDDKVKDDTPKTGTEGQLGIALFLSASAIIAIALLKRRSL